MSRRAILLMSLTAALVLVAAAPACAAAATIAARDFNIPQGADARCLACHARPDLGTIVVNGVRKSLTVPQNAWHDSMHSRLDCTACHAGFKAQSHTPAETSGWYLQAKLTACSDCHANIFAMYRGSFHGNLVMGKNSKAAPACGDCHGSHGIINPLSPAFRAAIPDICGRCHGEKSATYLDTYHGKSHRLGGTATAVCTDCHGSHSILPRSNPASAISKQNIVATCGKCHKDSSARFAGFLVHVDRSTPKSSLWVWLMEMNHALLIGVLFVVGGLHCFFYFYRGLKEGMYQRG